MNAIEAGLDPVEIKMRYNALKARRDELEHNLDEEKCRNIVMPTPEIKAYIERNRNVCLKAEAAKKNIIDLMVNSVTLREDGDIDICFNYREKEPKIKVPLAGSTTELTWSTIVNVKD